MSSGPSARAPPRARAPGHRTEKKRGAPVARGVGDRVGPAISILGMHNPLYGYKHIYLHVHPPLKGVMMGASMSIVREISRAVWRCGGRAVAMVPRTTAGLGSTSASGAGRRQSSTPSSARTMSTSAMMHAVGAWMRANVNSRACDRPRAVVPSSRRRRRRRPSSSIVVVVHGGAGGRLSIDVSRWDDGGGRARTSRDGCADVASAA